MVQRGLVGVEEIHGQESRHIQLIVGERLAVPVRGDRRLGERRGRRVAGVGTHPARPHDAAVTGPGSVLLGGRQILQDVVELRRRQFGPVGGEGAVVLRLVVVVVELGVVADGIVRHVPHAVERRALLTGPAGAFQHVERAVPVAVERGVAGVEPGLEPVAPPVGDPLVGQGLHALARQPPTSVCPSWRQCSSDLTFWGTLQSPMTAMATVTEPWAGSTTMNEASLAVAAAPRMRVTMAAFMV